MVPEEQHPELAKYLGAAAGNVVHAHASSGRTQEALNALQDLYGFADSSDAYPLERLANASASIVVESMLADAADTEARALLAGVASRWEAHGADRDELGIILSALGMRIEAVADERSLPLARRLLEETVTFAQRCHASPASVGVVADSMMPVLNAAIDQSDLETADPVFDAIVRLSEGGDDPRLAKARGLGAFALIVAYWHGEQADDAAWLARLQDVFEIGRAVFSEAFAEALRVDGAEDVTEKSRAVFRQFEASLVFGTEPPPSK
jgi:hypothetical protein